MKRSPLTSLALTFLLIVTGSALTSPALARQQRRQQRQEPQVASINKLRQQVQRMTAIELDDATPLEVRDINRAALSESRARLRELLQTRLDGLLSYRTEFKDSLTPDLAETLAQSIKETLAEMKALAGETPAGGEAERANQRRQARPAAATRPASEEAVAAAVVVAEAAPSEAEASPNAAAAQQAAASDLVIHAPREVSDKTAQVTITNTNHNIKSFALFKNGKPVSDKELPNADITIAQNAAEKNVSLTVEVPENATVKLVAFGLGGDGSFVSPSKPHEITRVAPRPTPVPQPGEGGGSTASRIEIKSPKADSIFNNVSTVEVKFNIKPKAGEKTEDRVKEVFVGVLNNGSPLTQDTPKTTIEYTDNQPQETTVRVRVGKGDNQIRLFSNYVEGKPVDLTTRTVVCSGDGCGSEVSTIPSNSMHMRAIVGFEQSGASSAASEGRPFLDLFFFGPLHFGKSCKKDVATENCIPWVSTWGDVRFSSVPQQISAFSSFASGFASPLAEGKLTELVQGFDFMAGLEIFSGLKTDRAFISPIPGIRHHTSMYFTGGFGAISPLDPQRSAQIFEIPVDANPQRATFLRDFPEATRNGAKYIAFVAPERDRFLRQYYGGVRFKTHFIDRNGDYINRFPAVLDVTAGQSDAVTGGRLSRVVFRLEAFYPFPVKEASFLYFYGSAMMKVGGRKTDKTPYALITAPSTVLLTGNDVVITTQQFNRDFYRIGIGVNLTDLFNRPRPRVQ